jgi:hypothetical protein
MSRRQVVKDIARRIPAELKRLRGKLMLEVLCETLGVAEVVCPACNGSGWLEVRLLERCPICCGFLEVPDGLAEWFKANIRRRTEGRGSTAGPHDFLPEHESAASAIERHGRTGEVVYSVCLPLIAVEF